MTREDVIKNWDVIEAFKNGEAIEYRSRLSSDWLPASSPSFASSEKEYRVKPNPEYVPFDFWDAEFLVGKAVKSKLSDVYVVITWLDTENVYIGTTRLTYKELYEQCVYLNEAPCGKLNTK